MINITPTQLRKAADLQERIQSLQRELNEILGGSGPAEPAAIDAPKKKWKFSAAARAKMRAAQKARWAKIKGTASTTPATKKKGKMSAAGRAAIRAAQKARWEKIRGESQVASTPAKATKAPEKKRKMTAAWRAALERAWEARRAKAAKSKP